MFSCILYFMIFVSKFMDRTLHFPFFLMDINNNITVSCKHCILYWHCIYFISHILFYIYLCFNLYRPPRGLSNTRLVFAYRTKHLYWHTGIDCIWSWFWEIAFQISVDDISWTSVICEKRCSIERKVCKFRALRYLRTYRGLLNGVSMMNENMLTVQRSK